MFRNLALGNYQKALRGVRNWSRETKLSIEIISAFIRRLS